MDKPVILLGNGVRGAPQLVDWALHQHVPILTTWMAADLVPEDDPYFCGRPGILGQRAANIIQQKATELFVFGARLDGEQVAYDYARFAPNAKRYIFEADSHEFKKFPDGWRAQLPQPLQIKWSQEWAAWATDLYARFRPELDGADGKFVDPFRLMTALHDFTDKDYVFAIGSSGNAPTAFFQSYKVKDGQRIRNACTIGAMGADIPMALGSALASGKRTICVTGDGGFQLNVQELETIRRLHLPITFFVLNNNGYASIRSMQDARFGRRVGCDPKSGFTLPRLEEIAGAYGFTYYKLWGAGMTEFEKCFTYAPMIVEVMCDPDWRQLPRVMASMKDGQYQVDDMQDMTPKIDDLQELMEWDG